MIAMPNRGNAKAMLFPRGGIRISPQRFGEASDYRDHEVSISLVVYNSSAQLDGDFADNPSRIDTSRPWFTTDSDGNKEELEDQHFVLPSQGNLGDLGPRVRDYTSTGKPVPDGDNSSVDKVNVHRLVTPVVHPESVNFISNHGPISISAPTEMLVVQVKGQGDNESFDSLTVEITCVVLGRLPNVSDYRLPAFDQGGAPSWWAVPVVR